MQLKGPISKETFRRLSHFSLWWILKHFYYSALGKMTDNHQIHSGLGNLAETSISRWHVLEAGSHVPQHRLASQGGELVKLD